ncbi:TPA: hypothetical protein JG904_000696 [Enterobacter hormaechei subsp. xiangfangensis]|nr:hypothetical protein [Enterobacter hormaechei subsp. xiangfangensis]
MFVINKLIWLGYTVSSGAARVIIFFLLTLVFVQKDIALFAVYYSFLTVAVIFLGQGLGTTLIKDGSEVSMKYFNYVLLLSIAAASVITLALATPTLDLNLIDTLIFAGSLACLAINQIYRYYYIYYKKALPGLIYDLLALVLFAAGMLLCKLHLVSLKPLDIFFLAYFIATIINQIIYYIYVKRAWITVSDSKAFNGLDWKFSLNVGFVGLISTGIVFLLPYFSRELLPDESMSVLGLTISIIGIISVFSRAYMNYFYRELVECAKSKEEKVYLAINKKVIIISALVCFGSILPLIFYIKLSLSYITFNEILAIVVPVMLFTLSSQLSLVQSNIILFLGKEKISLIFNFFVFIVVLSLFLVWQYFISISVIYLIPMMSLFLMVLYLIRYAYFRILIRTAFKNGEAV